jgi:hypothetical protein
VLEKLAPEDVEGQRDERRIDRQYDSPGTPMRAPLLKSERDVGALAERLCQIHSEDWDAEAGIGTVEQPRQLAQSGSRPEKSGDEDRLDAPRAGTEPGGPMTAGDVDALVASEAMECHAA